MFVSSSDYIKLMERVINCEVNNRNLTANVSGLQDIVQQLVKEAAEREKDSRTQQIQDQTEKYRTEIRNLQKQLEDAKKEK